MRRGSDFSSTSNIEVYIIAIIIYVGIKISSFM